MTLKFCINHIFLLFSIFNILALCVGTSLNTYTQSNSNSAYTNAVIIDSIDTGQALDIMYRITETFDVEKHGIFFALPYIQDGVIYQYSLKNAYISNKYNVTYQDSTSSLLNKSVTTETKKSFQDLKYEQAISHDEYRLRFGDKNLTLDPGTYDYIIHLSATPLYTDGENLNHKFNYLKDWKEDIYFKKITLEGRQTCLQAPILNIEKSDPNCSIENVDFSAQFNASSSEKGMWLWRINNIITITLVTLVSLLALVIFLYFYFKYAKDPTSKYPTDRPEFEPPRDLYPWEAQFLISGVDGRSTLLSYILWLNHKGFVVIEQNQNENNTGGFLSIFMKEPDKMIIKIKNELPKNILPDYFNETVNIVAEKGLTLGLSESKFTLQSTGLSDYFFSQLKRFYERTTSKTMLVICIAHSIALFILFSLVVVIQSNIFISDWTLNLFLILIAIPLPFETTLLILWPKVTQAGAELRAYCQRYKYYLTYVEKYKLDFSNNPDEGVQFYLKSVPMAAAFGILDKFNTYFGALLPTDRSGSVSSVSTFGAVYGSTFDSVFSSSSSGGGGGGGSSGGGGSW